MLSSTHQSYIQIIFSHLISSMSSVVEFPSHVSTLFPFLLSYIGLPLGLNSESTPYIFFSFLEYRALSSLSGLSQVVVGTSADFGRWDVWYDARDQRPRSHPKAPESELPLL